MGLKLFIITRSDLSPAQQAVQCGHSVAEFGLVGGFRNKDGEKWINGILVYLVVPNEQYLVLWVSKLENADEYPVVFAEPDLDYQITAIACCTDRYNLFSNLKMMGE